MNAAPQRLHNDLHTYGFLFESMCVRDLKIYAESFGASVFHYRDELGREIDAVIELPDGRWGAFEIKLRVDNIDKAANDLLKLKKLWKWIREQKLQMCCVLYVVFFGFAFTEEDGVMVVPVTALKN